MFVPGGQDDYDEFNINYSDEGNNNNNNDPNKACCRRPSTVFIKIKQKSKKFHGIFKLDKISIVFITSSLYARKLKGERKFGKCRH